MKEINNIIICLLVVLALYACNNKCYDPDELIEIEYAGVSDTLKGEKLNTQFGVVSKLYFVNTYLVGLTSQSSHFLEVCRPEYDTCVVSFGEFGRSRNDFVDMPYDVYARDTKRGPELYIADGGSSITKVVDLELSFKKGRTVVNIMLYRNPKRTMHSIKSCLIMMQETIFISPQVLASTNKVKRRYMIFIPRYCL